MFRLSLFGYFTKKGSLFMEDTLTRREAIAVMVMQAIILKRETIRPTPRQAARAAIEHTDALLKIFAESKRKGLRCISSTISKKVY